jgi:high-affinity K+ transport system ATPase subunit B
VASGNAVRAIQSTATSEAAREIQAISDEIAKAGGTPLAVAKDGRLLGVVQLKDIVKGGIRERFAELRRMGIRTVMITGDNPMTAAAIAAVGATHLVGELPRSNGQTTAWPSAPSRDARHPPFLSLPISRLAATYIESR